MRIIAHLYNMNLPAYNKGRKQSLLDSLYFWGFWIIATGLLVAVIEGTFTGAAKAILALIIPHILPVYLISFLFDALFMKKRILLFFLISIPLTWFMGMLINIWFYRIMKDSNIAANNEVLIFVFAAMFIGLRYIRVAIAQRILLKEEENKRVLAELQYLRSQLNPHFLFNSLNSIYSLILSKSEKAGEATLALSELMRFHIDLSGKQFIDLTDEIALVERYIALEKLKLEDRCDIQFTIEGDPKKIRIAPLLFMPFVENAFKHGISSVPASNFIHVRLVIKQNDLGFEISNSIPEKQSTEKSTAIKLGVENTVKRLELHYKGRYTFSNSKAGKKYLVNIAINFNEHAA